MNVRMRTAKAIAFSFFLALVTLGAISTRAQEKTGSTADSAAIKQFIATFSDNFNRHDARAAAMAFAEDAELTNIRGTTTHGRPAIAQAYTELFQGRLKNAHRTVAVTSIRFLTPSIASVECTWQTSGTTTDTGAAMPDRHGILVLVMTKSSGQWIITTYHEPEYASEK
jgi:uncharacterized protein (TIGR02246 family)